VSLQRRLLLYLLLGAPLVWAAAFALSFHFTRSEVDELFDSEMTRLAQQVQATLERLPPTGGDAAAAPPGDRGAADLHDFATAAWNGDGRVLYADREGARLPYRSGASGFVSLDLDGVPWRVYYLRSADGQRVVASGQNAEERSEVVAGLVGGQLAPWLLMLPLLLAAMALAVRRALAPLRQLAAELHARRAGDLQPLADAGQPAELVPVIGAMNGLFERIAAMLERERRFTADAAHELRTPLAALRAQWDVLQRAADGDERRDAALRLAAGFERVERLVRQMLLLSRLDSGAEPPKRSAIDWPRVVEQAIDDCLSLAERRRIEIACEWPAAGEPTLPLSGDAALLAVLLRNLLDNAVRYAPEGSTVLLRFGPTRIDIENEGAPPPEALARLGERFFRAAGQAESGSGLGLSIAHRIAALHALELRLDPRPGEHGMRATLTTGQTP
jgi:two-component system sensor histidine kinase QseC